MLAPDYAWFVIRDSSKLAIFYSYKICKQCKWTYSSNLHSSFNIRISLLAIFLKSKDANHHGSRIIWRQHKPFNERCEPSELLARTWDREREPNERERSINVGHATSRPIDQHSESSRCGTIVIIILENRRIFNSSNINSRSATEKAHLPNSLGDICVIDCVGKDIGVNFSAGTHARRMYLSVLSAIWNPVYRKRRKRDKECRLLWEKKKEREKEKEERCETSLACLSWWNRWRTKYTSLMQKKRQEKQEWE